jgi:hypothetical protein
MLTGNLFGSFDPFVKKGADLQPVRFTSYPPSMIDVHLDALASSVNFIGGIFLAIDALTARRRTKVKRGATKLVQGLAQEDAKDKMSAGAGQPPAPAAPTRSEKIQSPDGEILDSIEALENWADKLSTKRARTGFILLAIGFGLDLFSKVFYNPLFFSI